MYKVLFTARSLKSVKKLPIHIQNKVDTLADILSIDYHDNRLRTKKLKIKQSVYSFRASREYRGIFEFIDSSTIKILDIKHRKDIYKRIR